MLKWQKLTVIVLGGILPMTITIVSLQQFKIIGLDTALLLGLLYLLFLSTHVWCRIFTKIPPTDSREQVDSLPCYEEATKDDLPSYSSLFIGNPKLSEAKASSSTQSSKNSKTDSTRSQFIHGNSSLVNLNPLSDLSSDDSPILEKSARSHSLPILVVPTDARPTNSTKISNSRISSCDTFSASNEKPDRKLEVKTLFTNMISSIANPADIV